MATSLLEIVQGQKAAYADLKDKVQFRRKYRGEHVVPLVELSSKPMKTRFGMRARPHFEVVSWQQFGPPAAEQIAAPVAPLTPAEITGDSIPDFPAPNAEGSLKVGNEWVAPWDDPIGDLNP